MFGPSRPDAEKESATVSTVSRPLWVFAFLAGLTVTGASADPGPFRAMRWLQDHAAPGMRLPTDVAVGDGRLFAVDSAGRRIRVMDIASGRWRPFGDTVPALQAPVGLGLGPAGRLWVADRGAGQVLAYDSDGGHLQTIDVAERPIDVAVARDGRTIYVTGNRHHRVLVYSSAGRLLRRWGGNGLNPGEFRYPATLAVLPGRRLAVVDVLNTRVQLFEEDGRFLRQVGGWGVRPGQLFRPKGVAVDRRGRIYVSDSYLEVVQVFDPDGEFLYALRAPDRPLVTPAGLAIDGRGRLYVAEMLTHRIGVFQVPE